MTVVVTGRNDGYGGDFVGRLVRTLTFNMRELERHEIPWEYILVEWAPPPDVPLLSQLVLQACPAVRHVLRAFVVDPAYHDAFTLNPRVAYLEFVAKNVGIRRAAGRLVLTTNADVYVGRRVLERLARREIEPGTLYRARRIDLKLGLDASTMAWDVLEDGRNYESGAKPLRPPLYAGGTGDFVLLDSDTFARLRGFNEVYRVAKIGIDRNLLVKALSAGVSIADIGGPVYHINHPGSYRATKSQYEGQQADAPYGDHRWPASHVVYENPSNWGLAEAPAIPLFDGVTRLQFSWRTVPPLVDFGRLLPSGLAPAEPDGESL